MKKVLFIILGILLFSSCNKDTKQQNEVKYLVITWDNDSVYLQAKGWSKQASGTFFYSDNEKQYVSNSKHIIIIGEE